ncbi:MAG TPA: hypothetical protein VNK89_02165 [Thermoflexus sp.]|nr:hypothetical protein [Thermoflexus sp.]
MSSLTFLIALLGGVLTAAAGYVLQTAALVFLVPGWEGMMPSNTLLLASVGSVLALLLLTGVAAGRFARAQTRWGNVAAGALAGWMTAWVAEAMFGGFIAGLWGARGLLAHGLVPAESETAMLALLSESTLSIVVWICGSIALSAVTGMLLGALGGILGSLGARPSPPDFRFNLCVSGAMIPFSGAALIGMLPIYAALASVMEKSVREAGLTLPMPPSLVFDAPLAIYLIWYLFWAMLAWTSLRHLSGKLSVGLFHRLAFAVWGAVVGSPLAWLAGAMFAGKLRPSLFIFLFILAFSSVLIFVLLLLAGIISRISVILRPLFRPLFPQMKSRGIFQRLGELRLLAWFSLVWALIMLIVSWLLLPGEWRMQRATWLALGLLLGVLLGLDSVRIARTLDPIEESTPTPLNALRLLETVFPIHLLYGLTSILSLLAPIALITFLVPALPYIEPDATPQQAGDLVRLIQTALETTWAFVFGTFMWVPAASLASLLLWRIWSQLDK